MTRYWPMGWYVADGRIETAFTTDSASNLDKAIQQIHIWEEHYGYSFVRKWIQAETENRSYELPVGGDCKMLRGFTLYANGKDYFFITDKVNKTKALAKEICRAALIPDAPSVIHDVLRNLQRATLEIKGEKRKYYEISGEGFGGKGSFIDDGNTVVIELK